MLTYVDSACLRRRRLRRFLWDRGRFAATGSSSSRCGECAPDADGDARCRGTWRETAGELGTDSESESSAPPATKSTTKSGPNAVARALLAADTTEEEEDPKSIRAVGIGGCGCDDDESNVEIWCVHDGVLVYEARVCVGACVGS